MAKIGGTALAVGIIAIFLVLLRLGFLGSVFQSSLAGGLTLTYGNDGIIRAVGTAPYANVKSGSIVCLPSGSSTSFVSPTALYEPYNHLGSCGNEKSAVVTITYSYVGNCGDVQCQTTQTVTLDNPTYVSTTTTTTITGGIGNIISYISPTTTLAGAAPPPPQNNLMLIAIFAVVGAALRLGGVL